MRLALDLLSTIGTAASGQDARPVVPGLTMQEMVEQMTVPPPAPMEWQPEASVTSKDEALAALAEQGFTLPADLLASEGQLELYSRRVSPGVTEFLVVPQDGQPLEFSPQVVPAGWSLPTADQVGRELVSKMMAALQALCAMPARPTEIVARASAAGFLEVEATWQTSVACN